MSLLTTYLVVYLCKHNCVHTLFSCPVSKVIVIISLQFGNGAPAILSSKDWSTKSRALMIDRLIVFCFTSRSKNIQSNREPPFPVMGCRNSPKFNINHLLFRHTLFHTLKLWDKCVFKKMKHLFPKGYYLHYNLILKKDYQRTYQNRVTSPAKRFICFQSHMHDAYRQKMNSMIYVINIFSLE